MQIDALLAGEQVARENPSTIPKKAGWAHIVAIIGRGPLPLLALPGRCGAVRHRQGRVGRTLRGVEHNDW